MPAFDAIGMDAVGIGGQTSQSAPQPDPATVSSVTVSPASITLDGGMTRQFVAVVNGTNSPSQAVTWSIGAGSIDVNGNVTAPAAIASLQTITATATSVADPSHSGTATVIVPAMLPHVTPPVFTSTIHTRARHRGRR